MQEPIAMISQGLNEGDTVVVEGQYRLEDGSKVRIEVGPPTAAPGAAGPAGGSGSRDATNRPPGNAPPKLAGE
jgi:multidrug efflux system membrane fusion protein